MTSIAMEDSRKRDFETFDGETQLEEPCSIPPEYQYLLDGQSPEEQKLEIADTTGNNFASPVGDLMDITPARKLSSPAHLPTAFAAMKGYGAPPAKKTKLSYAEQQAEEELQRINKEIEEQEKAELKALKEAERNRVSVVIQAVNLTPKEIKAQAAAQEKAETKARRDAEREAEKKAAADEKARKREADLEEKRAAKEAEAEEKRVAKAARDEKKRLKDEDKRLKDEEKQRKENEKRKKEKAQLKLGNFFAIPASSNRSRSNSVDSHKRTSMSPAPSQATLPSSAAITTITTPSKTNQTPYDDLFPSFFKKDDVTVAPICRFQRDDEATEFLQNTIDGYLSGSRLPDTQRSFNVMSLFHMNFSVEFRSRGRQYVSVREIMSEYNPGTSTQVAIDLTTTDSQNSQIKRTSDLLRKIPVKILHFAEDVRPPYRGTYTKRPTTSTSKLARNPLRKDLPDTNYDYDSEAEWVEDDGEDLNSDGEDEDDDGEGEEMDGFLDDENDELANSRRLVIQGDLEPISTGLCWENRSKQNTNVKMVKYRMENILGMIHFHMRRALLTILDPKIKSIDPFSTSYWQPVLLPMDPPRLPLHTMKPNSVAQNGPSTSSSKTVKPFFSVPSPSEAQKASPSPAPSTPSVKQQAKVGKDGKPMKTIPAEDLPAFKTAILSDDLNTLSKVGLIEVLKKRFPGRSAAMIKNTLEIVAERQGAKEKDKRWVIITP